MQLQLMQNELQNGAMCLDGSPAGFYFSRATTPESNDKWQIYFQGGGWCYSEADCWGRSKTGLGTSKGWANTSSIGGIMSDDCSVNPDFCTWNRVHMAYCDGNSFSGNRDEPIVYNGDKIYFRGRRIIDATFRTLFKFGLSSASEVFLTGCSAGGLATYLHADYVGSILQNVTTLKKFKAASISGFFLLHNTVEGKPVYPDEMKTIFALANSTHGLNEDCIKNTPAEDQWQCNFAEKTYPHIKTPFMPLNSALDSWQTGCIYTSEPVPSNDTTNGYCGAAPGWKSCSQDPTKCNATQIAAMVQYERDFVNTMQGSPTFTKEGNGAFIYSCHTHCASQSSAYNRFAIDGTTIQQAVSKFWNSDQNTPATSNTHMPCYYKTEAPYACNPTC